MTSTGAPGRSPSRARVIAGSDCQSPSMSGRRLLVTASGVGPIATAGRCSCQDAPRAASCRPARSRPRSVGLPLGPGCPASAPTGSDTPQRPSCCEPAARCSRSVASCASAACGPPRSTRRSTRRHWAMAPTGTNADWWRARLSVVHGFAAYMATLDPATEVPPADLLPHRAQRATPYLLCEADVVSLMAAADTLVPPLRAATYRTLLGLLAVSGLRVGEAIRLDRGDVTLAEGLLLVRDSKWNKSRTLPLHASTIDALGDYAKLRDRLCPAPKQPSFFVSTRGTRLVYSDIRRTLLELASRAGMQLSSPSHRLRPHALRHSFAVASLLDWYRAG